ncbi:MAG: hypothetical protein LC797_11220, partial [Chloroflexi bacterium]|nr:hypothetical protein [Chloroflexota bacterium]
MIRDVTERRRAEDERLALAREQAARAEAQEQADVHVRLSAALRGLVEERDAALANVERAREQVEFLAEASREMADSLEYEITLATVARLAVPVLADWCAVDMLGEDGAIQRLAVAHVDPAKVELAQAIGRRYPPHQGAAGGVPGVIRSGRAELHPNISNALLVQVARDAEHLELLRR